MNWRPEYPRELKESVVDLVINKGRTAQAISDELGVCPTTIRRWVREKKAAQRSGLRVFPGRGKSRDEELALLRKENADLRETNEILKKAMAFFAEETPG